MSGAGEVPRVVLDATIFVQALINRHGPAARCIDRMREGVAVLLLSDAVLAEVSDVPLRPSLTRRYSQLTETRVHAFVDEMRSLAVHIATPPNLFALPRDPKDEPYTDLAIAGGARFLVTWNDRHLTYLMRRSTPEGRDFCDRFPGLLMLTPPEFLTAVPPPSQD